MKKLTKRNNILNCKSNSDVRIKIGYNEFKNPEKTIPKDGNNSSLDI